MLIENIVGIDDQVVDPCGITVGALSYHFSEVAVYTDLKTALV